MKVLLIALILSMIVTSLNALKLPPLTTVENVDLQKYKGLWYQIAYFPTSFQPKDAQLTTAEYQLSDKGYIIVINKAYKDAEGKILKSKIKGKAFLTKKKDKNREVDPGKLKVQFFWPFKGDYWIILLDNENYQWAVISNPTRKYFWLLARDPVMDEETYLTILNQAEAKHIDISKIVITGKIK
jgi:apolipoprotein D and lipocalin family protein